MYYIAITYQNYWYNHLGHLLNTWQIKSMEFVIAKRDLQIYSAGHPGTVSVRK